MSTLDVSLIIETPTGPLELEDAANGYELHADSLAQRAVSWRRQDVEGQWLEGTYTAHAVRGNVAEAVVVWVEGVDSSMLQDRVELLIAGLEQLRFQITLRIGTNQEVWTCMASDYTIEASQPLRFATMALVRANVPRLPSVVRSTVSAP